MALPTFDDNLHDIGINGYGWMILKDPAQVAGVMLQDWVPGQSRSALGEGENDSFEGSSFM